MRVGPAGQHLEPALLKRLRQRVRIRPHLALVLPERLGSGDLEAAAFAAITWFSGPPCIPGNTARSSAVRVLLLAEDEAGARPGQRLVRGRGDEVAVGNRVGMDSRGYEPREVRHVAEQIRTHLVGDLAEPRGLDRPRVRRASAHDELRPVLLRKAEHVVVVDEVRLARYAVVRDRVQPAGEVDLQTRGSDGRRARARGRGSCPRARGMRSTRPCSSALRHAAGRSRARRRRGPLRGRSPAARSRRSTSQPP